MSGSRQGRPRRDLSQNRIIGPVYTRRKAAGTHARYQSYVRTMRLRNGRRTTDRQYRWHCTRYPVCQKSEQWIRSLQSKTGCIKRGGRLRQPFSSDAPSATALCLCKEREGGGAGVAPASLYTQAFTLKRVLYFLHCPLAEYA